MNVLSNDVTQSTYTLRSDSDAFRKRTAKVKQLDKDVAKLGRELTKVRTKRHAVEAQNLAAAAAPAADPEYDDDSDYDPDADDPQVAPPPGGIFSDDDSEGDFDDASPADSSTDSDADDSDIPDDA